MKAEKSIDLIARLQQKTEEHIAFAVNTLQNLKGEILLKPSRTGGWSIAQCLDHLNRYGKYYLPQILSAMDKSNKPTDEFFKSSWIGNYFTNTMNPQTGKTYKAFKEYIPEQDLDAHAVVAEFIQQQETLLHYLQKANETNLDVRVPISISKLIMLKLGDTFQFLIMHNERHVLQAKKNLPG